MTAVSGLSNTGSRPLPPIRSINFQGPNHANPRSHRNHCNPGAPLQHGGRFDLYGQVHKGLRAFMCATLVELGRLDGGNDQEVKRVLDQLDELLDLCLGHIGKEDIYVHAAMQARSANAALQVAGEHEEHAIAIEGLRAAANVNKTES
jgi:hypothetical protein